MHAKKNHKLILLGYEVLLELYRITAIELAGAIFIDLWQFGISFKDIINSINGVIK